MEILLAPEAADELARLFAAAGPAPERAAQAGAGGNATPAPHARLSRDAEGAWRLAIAPPEPGDHVGYVGGFPFAAEGRAAEDVGRLLVDWRGGEFVIGEVASESCGLDPEIRE